jgi:hypothetical protein
MTNLRMKVLVIGVSGGIERLVVDEVIRQRFGGAN